MPQEGETSTSDLNYRDPLPLPIGADNRFVKVSFPRSRGSGGTHEPYVTVVPRVKGSGAEETRKPLEGYNDRVKGVAEKIRRSIERQEMLAETRASILETRREHDAAEDYVESLEDEIDQIDRRHAESHKREIARFEGLVREMGQAIEEDENVRANNISYHVGEQVEIFLDAVDARAGLESRSDYMKRCMGHIKRSKTLSDEIPRNNQRVAACLDTYRRFAPDAPKEE